MSKATKYWPLQKYCGFYNTYVVEPCFARITSRRKTGFPKSTRRKSNSYRICKGYKTLVAKLCIPRLSYYIANNMQSEYNKQLKTILQTVIVLIAPVTVGVIMLRREVILLLADESYMGAIESLVILCAALPVCVLATFVGQCILMPFKEEKVIFKATIISAAVNLVLNLILIPFFAQNAAAFTTLLAEGTALIIQAYYARKYVKLSGIFKTSPAWLALC